MVPLPLLFPRQREEGDNKLSCERFIDDAFPPSGLVEDRPRERDGRAVASDGFEEDDKLGFARDEEEEEEDVPETM